MWKQYMQVRLVGCIIATALVLSGCEEHAPAAKETTVAASNSSPAQDRLVIDPFPSATEVRLFIEVGYSNDGAPKLSATEGRLLTPGQRSELESMLSITKAPVEAAACFIPHHFFRYYNSAGKMIGEVAVCFCCEGFEVTGDSNFSVGRDQIVTAHYDAIKRLVKELHEPVNVPCE